MVVLEYLASVSSYLILGAVISLGLITVAQYVKGVYKYVHLPGPRPIVPLIGSLWALKPRPGELPFETLSRLASRYGPIMFLQMGSYPTVVVSDLSSFQGAFVAAGPHTIDRPPGMFLFQLMDDIGERVQAGEGFEKKISKIWNVLLQLVGLGTKLENRHGIVMSSGTEWKTFRHLILPSLIASRDLDAIVHAETTNMIAQIRVKGSDPQDLRPVVSKTVASIMLHVIFGSFDVKGKMSDKLLGIIHRANESAGIFLPEQFLPWMRFIPGRQQHLEKITRLREEMTSFLRDAVKLYRRQEGVTQGSRPLVKQLFGLNEKEMILNLRDIFLAGTETTTSSLLWVIVYLLRYPDHMRKGQQQLRKSRGSVGDITRADESTKNGLGEGPDNALMGDQSKAPFVKAFIMETLRLASTTPVSLPHYTTRDVTVAGCTVPRGTTIIANLHAVARDSDVWRDPEEFDPGRWLDGEGNYRHCRGYAVFGTGRRQCAGERMAHVVLFNLTSALLRHFRLSLPEGDKIPGVRGLSGVTHFPRPFKVVCEPQSLDLGRRNN